jgi:hypothetical protein
VLGALRLGSLTICGVLVLGAAGCGDDDADEPVTDLETGDGDATTTAELDDEQAVVAAYEASWQALLDSGDPPTPDAPVLEETMTGPALDSARNFLGENASEGLVLRGTYTNDARATDVAEESATVEDCGEDGTSLIVEATGQAVEEPDETPEGVVAELVKEDGSWKVRTLRYDDRVCG